MGVSNQEPDGERLEPMLERIASHGGARSDVMGLDAGYWSEDNSRAYTNQGIDGSFATGRPSHAKPPLPRREPLPRDADGKTQRPTNSETSKDQPAKPAGRRSWNRRTVRSRTSGAWGASCSELEKVEAPWHLIAGSHNQLKLWRFRRSQQQGLVAATGWGERLPT